MEIRDATPADAQAIRSVHRRSIDELGPQAYDQEQVKAWAEGCEDADYTTAIEASAMAYVVADRDGTVVGFGSLQLAPPAGYDASVDAEVTGVYVDPGVARDGVGTRLYAELERRAEAAGIGSLGLTASRNAVPFYDAHGYDRVAEHTHEFSSHRDTGVTGVVVEMAKDL